MLWDLLTWCLKDIWQKSHLWKTILERREMILPFIQSCSQRWWYNSQDSSLNIASPWFDLLYVSQTHPPSASLMGTWPAYSHRDWHSKVFHLEFTAWNSFILSLNSCFGWAWWCKTLYQNKGLSGRMLQVLSPVLHAQLCSISKIHRTVEQAQRWGGVVRTSSREQSHPPLLLLADYGKVQAWWQVPLHIWWLT